jgi:hypothetical protein
VDPSVGVGLGEAALWGAAGGAIVELLYLRNLHRQVKRKLLPAFVRSWTYAIMAACAIGGSAILPVIYVRSNFDLAAIVAFSVGASMPAFVQAAGTLIPDIDKGRTN